MWELVIDNVGLSFVRFGNWFWLIREQLLINMGTTFIDLSEEGSDTSMNNFKFKLNTSKDFMEKLNISKTRQWTDKISLQECF